ncbi:MAG: hypothetical protein M1818_005049 [Claussenomyces sp. TS43310]|nr:MAG: hypothetical protein M1818_005049 [Claussenomyces sp. TS43310]
MTGESTSVEPFDPPGNCVNHDHNLTRREKLSNLADKSKEKVKNAFSSEQNGRATVDDRSPEQKALDTLHQNPAFDPSQVMSKPGTSALGILGKTIDVFQIAGDAVIHPKKTLKSRATKTTAGQVAKVRPYASKEADMKFLDVAQSLDNVESSKFATDDKETVARQNEKIDDLNTAIEDMEEKRSSMRVAWQSNRNIQRVKVVRRVPGRFPEDSFFEEEDDCGATKFRWDKWIAYVGWHRNYHKLLSTNIPQSLLYASHHYTAQYIDDFDELSFDLDTLRRHIERLIIVSADVQTWLSEVRRVYRWENPAVTGKWMALSFVLWYFSHIMTFADSLEQYGYVFFRVARNYYYPDSLVALRESLERTLDRGATAMKVVEMMDKHGDSNWLEPLLDVLGPTIQLQVNDLANMLERISNFYEWKSAAKTRATLSMLFVLFLICLIASPGYCLEIVYFIIGLIFFVCWPVSSHYPKYRLLVSPIQWAFWDIPTHAEWSIQYLQQHSIAVLKALESRTDDTAFTGTEGMSSAHADREGLHVHSKTTGNGEASPPDVAAQVDSDLQMGRKKAVDILSFRCVHARRLGDLIISSTGVRFRSSLPHTLEQHPSPDFSFHFAQLDEMRKTEPSVSALNKASMMTTRVDKLELRILSAADANGVDDGWGRRSGKEGREFMYEKPETTLIQLEAVKERDKAFNTILAFSGLKWQNLQSGWDT